MIGLFLSLSLLAAQDSSNAYLDARARDLISNARGRRDVIDRSITRYQATAKERISVGLRTKLRERLFWRRETASRIDWRRGGPINITVLGAREVVPVASAKPQIPGDLKDFLPRLAFDPLDPDVLIRVDTSGIRHPMSPGSEKHYQFRTGDSTTINLGTRTIRLIELQIIPRRKEFTLISGSFWFDADTYAPVQLVFRLASDFDLMRDGVDEDDKDDMKFVPGFMKPIRAELQYMTIEYGLIHLRWWLPRLFAAEGMWQMGPIRTPINYERSYSDYEVEADTTIAVTTRGQLTEAELAALKPCTPNTSMQISVDTDDDKDTPEARERIRRREAARDSARARARADRDSARVRAQRDSGQVAQVDTARQRRRREMEECSKRYTVTIADSSKLINSSELPPTVYGDKEELSSDPELQSLADKLRRLAEPPWQARAPSFAWGIFGNSLTRYNKIEGLSMGARTEFDFGRLRADLTGRIGVADLEPRGEFGITRIKPGTWSRLAAYRRLDVMDKVAGFGGFTGSMSALLFGVDTRSYYDNRGAELILRNGEVESQWYDLRVYGEMQRALSKETEFSLRHALNGSTDFDPNLQASKADQAGAVLTLRKAIGINPARPRLAFELVNEASTGTFTFTKHAALLQLTTPLFSGFSLGLEGAGGTTTSDTIATNVGPAFSMLPLQNHFFLGGARSMRGYDVGEEHGTAFWRGRAELARGIPAARISLFSDFGWAGDRRDVSTRASMLSVGIGASFLDGLVRADLARALRGNQGFKFTMSVDGIL